jgi:hypothetical protein
VGLQHHSSYDFNAFAANAMLKNLKNKDMRGTPLQPRRFWVLGAGYFGSIALERILRRIPDATITVVDMEPRQIEDSRITTVTAEGIQWLDAMLDHQAPVDIIVPAIPVHVAAEWVKLNLLKTCQVQPADIPDAWLARMHNPVRGKTGQVYVSHADFICPDNCPEPQKKCTHTGKPRPEALYRLLQQLYFETFLPIVLRSHQLLAGVGGIYPSDLMTARDTARQNSHRPLMICTACSCHGVMDFMHVKPGTPVKG